MMVGLRRKHLREYRAMRQRLVQALPEVAEAMGRVRAGALAAASGRRYYSSTDADALCALVIEAVAWWGAQDRNEVRAIRSAADELEALQYRIDAAVTELCDAVESSKELCTRFGLRVNHPMWRDNLGEVVAEARHRFYRWGNEPVVKALEDFETKSWYSPRPGVLDLVQIARNIGALHTVGTASPIRRSGGEWLRYTAPWVSADDAQAEEALRKGAGSGQEKRTTQLRQLIAELHKLGLDNGWIEGEPGPLDFLNDRDLSVLCGVAVGPSSDPSKDDPFNPGTVQKARASFRDRQD